jgi:hypothetical protein
VLHRPVESATVSGHSTFQIAAAQRASQATKAGRPELPLVLYLTDMLGVSFVEELDRYRFLEQALDQRYA